jgi:hypothetical protein
MGFSLQCTSYLVCEAIENILNVPILSHPPLALDKPPWPRNAHYITEEKGGPSAESAVWDNRVQCEPMTACVVFITLHIIERQGQPFSPPRRHCELVIPAFKLTYNKLSV